MKRGTPRHHKTRIFARALNIPIYAATGILEMLWQYTEEFAVCGDIGKVEDIEIAGAVGWDRQPIELIDALVSCHWLDRSSIHRLVVHDWHEHCNDYTKRKVKEKGLSFASLTRPPENSGKSPEKSGESPGNFLLPCPVQSKANPEPLPEPVPPVQSTAEAAAKLRMGRKGDRTDLPTEKAPSELDAIVLRIRNSGVDPGEPIDKFTLRLLDYAHQHGMSGFAAAAKIERAMRKASKREEWSPQGAGWFFGVLRSDEVELAGGAA